MTSATNLKLARRPLSSVPPADILLWDALETHKLRQGMEMGRDRIVGDHVVPISSNKTKIAVEFDLPPEGERSNEDLARIAALELRHYEIIYITSAEVYENVEDVVKRIVKIANAKSANKVQKTSSVGRTV